MIGTVSKLGNNRWPKYTKLADAKIWMSTNPKYFRKLLRPELFEKTTFLFKE